MEDARLKKFQSIHKKILCCKKCSLHQSRLNAVPGEGPLDAKVFFIAQAPGRKEDEIGFPFVGKAGTFLNKLLKKHSLKREEVFITSSLKCFPPNNRVPKDEEIEAYKPFTVSQVKLVNPKIIVLLGKVAQKHFLVQDIIKGKKVVKTLHPSACMRFTKMRKRIEKDFRRLKKLILE